MWRTVINRLRCHTGLFWRQSGWSTWRSRKFKPAINIDWVVTKACLQLHSAKSFLWRRQFVDRLAPWGDVLEDSEKFSSKSVYRRSCHWGLLSGPSPKFPRFAGEVDLVEQLSGSSIFTTCFFTYSAVNSTALHLHEVIYFCFIIIFLLYGDVTCSCFDYCSFCAWHHMVALI